MPTTATEWLIENPGDVYALGELFEGLEGFPIWLWTEIPLWMKQVIAEQLAESFVESYWDVIAKTTQGDAENALIRGLGEGWSIRKIAKEMEESLGGDKYARQRAMNIARTEAGNALNGARKASINQMIEDLGPLVPMRPSWLSVLGTTTRDSHASLDGVPADENGMWLLAGLFIPWPGYFGLPPEERCNCQCTIVMEYGMQASEAEQLIRDYYEREESNLGEEVDELGEKFNPYHDPATDRFVSNPGGGPMEE